MRAAHYKLHWGAIILVLGSLLLPGCATFTKPGTIPVSQTFSPLAQQAQTAINESNILLAAAADVIGQNVQAGVYTKAEAQKRLDRVKALGADVDRAQALLDSGEAMAAKDKAELTMRLITVLQKELADARRKQ